MTEIQPEYQKVKGLAGFRLDRIVPQHRALRIARVWRDSSLLTGAHLLARDPVQLLGMIARTAFR